MSLTIHSEAFQFYFHLWKLQSKNKCLHSLHDTRRHPSLHMYLQILPFHGPKDIPLIQCVVAMSAQHLSSCYSGSHQNSIKGTMTEFAS